MAFAAPLQKVLNCLWQKKIVYTDIKPQNLLYQCTGPSKFDVVLADLGDVIFMEPGQRVAWYAESYPYPFPKERKDLPPSEKKVEYDDLIAPLTMENAEHHMVWGVAAFFFAMTHPLAHNALYWGRDYTNEEFMKMRKMLVKTTEGGAGIFGKALLDPTKFKLSEFLGDSRKRKRSDLAAGTKSDEAIPISTQTENAGNVGSMQKRDILRIERETNTRRNDLRRAFNLRAGATKRKRKSMKSAVSGKRIKQEKIKDVVDTLSRTWQKIIEDNSRKGIYIGEFSIRRSRPLIYNGRRYREVDIAIENDGEHNEAMKFLMKALKDFKRRNLLRNHGLRLDIYSGANEIPDDIFSFDMLRYLRIFDAGLTTLPNNFGEILAASAKVGFT